MTAHRLRRARRVRQPLALLAVLAFLATMVLGTAGPASAHTTLVSSDPAQGAVLPEAPERIRFTYTEAVAAVPDGVQVFDAAGNPVPSSAAVGDKTLDVTLSGEVGEGTFIVTWRVVSEDGHPVSGSLSFSIGAPSADVVQPAGGASGSSTEAPLALRLVRWLSYLGLLMAVGLVGFIVLVLPHDELAEPDGRRLVRWARTAGAVTAVAWAAALPLTASYQVAGDLGALGKGSTWAALTTTEYGVAAAVVVGANLAVALVAHGSPDRTRRLLATAAALVAVCAPALTGHTRAATPELLAVGAAMVHLVAGSVWFGGLVALALVLPGLLGRGALAAQVLARFSGIAAGVLVALVLTGSLLAWRIVGSWSTLFEATYGRVLLLKIATAAIAVAIAAWNRYRLLPRMQDGRRRADREAAGWLVARATTLEAATLVGVLLVTGILVDRSPEADAAASRPEVQQAMLGAYKVTATMTPLETGPATVTIETRDATGEFIEGLEAPKAELSSGAVDLGPLELTNIGPGTYTGEAVLPSPGTWRLQVSLRLTELDTPVTVVEFPVEDD